MTQTLANFIVIESVYGKFVVNRHCDLQAEAMNLLCAPAEKLKTSGLTFDEQRV